jgi:hypothetical protein
VEGPVVLMLLLEIARNSIEFYVVILHKAGRDGAVGIATRYGLDGSGIESR